MLESIRSSSLHSHLLYLILSRQTCMHRENAMQRLELCCQNSRNYSKWGLRSRAEPSLVFSEGASPCWHLTFGFTLWACLMAQLVKNLSAICETWVLMATHSSIAVLEIPWTEKPDGLQFVRSQRVGHDWVTRTNTLWLWDNKFQLFKPLSVWYLL